MKTIIFILGLIFSFKSHAQKGRIVMFEGKSFAVISDTDYTSSYDSVKYNKNGDTAYLYRHPEKGNNFYEYLKSPLFTVKFYLKGRFVFSFESTDLSIDSKINTGHYRSRVFEYDRVEASINKNYLFNLK